MTSADTGRCEVHQRRRAEATGTALEVNGPDTGGVGWTAGVLALLAFWGSLALALSFDQLLGIPGALVVRPYTPPAPPGAEPPVPEPARPPAWLFSWPMALGFAALLAIQLVYLARGSGEAVAASPGTPSSFI